MQAGNNKIKSFDPETVVQNLIYSVGNIAFGTNERMFLFCICNWIKNETKTTKKKKAEKKELICSKQ